MYTTQANIEARLGTSLTATQITYFTTVLGPAIDTVINNLTGTHFGAGSAADEDVYVSGEDSEFLLIPTMNTITSVFHVSDADEETGISVDEYTTYPRGEANKYALRKKTGDWEDGFDNYKVTGKLGYVETPEDITLVATELATIGLTSASTSTVKSEKVGDWAVTYAEVKKSLTPESLSILNSYRRISRSM